MYKFEFSGLKVGEAVWVKAFPANARTIEELEAFRGLLDKLDQASIDECCRGPWEYLGRYSSTGNPWSSGVYARLRNTAWPGLEIYAHRMDLLREDALADPKPVLKLVEKPPKEPEVAPPPWAKNRDVGAIYLSIEPAGTFTLSLVFSGEGGEKGKSVSRMTGLKGSEVPDAVALLGKRLGGRAVEKAAKEEAS